METKENILQLLKVITKAISMEKNAENFYKTVAEQTQSEEGRKLFVWLSQFEASHRLRLTSRRNELLENPLLQNVKIPEQTDYDISEAKIWEDMPKVETDMEILKLALKNENRAYAYYQRKITMAPDEPTRELFEKLASEEDKHIRILSDQLHSMKMNKIYRDFSDSIDK